MTTNQPEKYLVFICPVAIGAHKNQRFLRQIEQAKQEGSYFYVLIEYDALCPQELADANICAKEYFDLKSGSCSLEDAVQNLLAKLGKDIPSMKDCINEEYVQGIKKAVQFA